MTTRAAAAAQVVVAFDPFAPDRAALQLALRLAAPGTASVLGLYVEETDPLLLGAFPWAREIATATGQARPLQAQAVERGYIGRAAEARALFDATVAGLVDATFERVRGRSADELRRVAADASVVMLDWPAAGRRSRHRAAALVQALLELAAPLVGLVNPGGPIAAVAIVSTDAMLQPARELAQRLAAPAAARIAVVREPTSAAAIIEHARVEGADTLLLQGGEARADAALLTELALAWPGSLLLLR